MLEVPVELLERREAYCGGHDVVVQIESPDWGLDAYLWRTDSETILKVYRYKERFQKELATYRRLAERSITRLKGFQFPQLVDYDEDRDLLRRCPQQKHPSAINKQAGPSGAQFRHVRTTVGTALR